MLPEGMNCLLFTIQGTQGTRGEWGTENSEEGSPILGAEVPVGSSPASSAPVPARLGCPPRIVTSVLVALVPCT